MRNRKQTRLSTLLLIAIVAMGSGCQKQQSENVLAEINGLAVTELHFQNSFKEYFYRTGQVLTPDLETKKAVLDAEFNTYVLSVYAQDLGLHATPESQNKYQAIERRVINEEYLEQVILDSIEVSEVELQEYFVRFNSSLRASHLYARTEEKINEYYERLQQGESFEDLAKEAFQNEYMARNGGDIGRFTTDELDIAFEEQAFNMNIGEVSEPVRTAQGYSIIKLTDRTTRPLLTEYEYAQRKPMLQSYVYKKKKELRTREHMYEFTIGVQFTEDAINDLWMRISENYDAMLRKDPEFIAALSGNEVLLSFEDFTFDMNDFAREYPISSQAMLNGIQDKQSMKNFLKGLAYRDFLYTEAMKAGIDEQREVLSSVEETWHHYLADMAINELRNGIKNTPAELYQTYSENTQDFFKPLEVNLGRIVLGDKEKALTVLRALEDGEDFNTLLQQHTVSNEDRFTNGELGYRSIKDYGFNANALSQLEIGELSDVIEYKPSEYHIYKMLGRKEGRLLSFDEAKSLVENYLTRRKLMELQKSTIEQVKNKHNAVIKTEKLKELTIQI